MSLTSRLREEPREERAAPETLSTRFRAVRSATEALAAPLSAEDCQVQSATEASPIKWHLAHTSWFFETFVLAAAQARYRPFSDEFAFLFNSYYESVGPRLAREKRGLLTRPTLADVRAYREAVDARVLAALERGALSVELCAVLELGLQHEQQHQELVLTDLAHHLWHNPLRPAYREARDEDEGGAALPLAFVRFAGGLVEIGDAQQGARFAFDNERPRHKLWLEPFALANRPVTNAEWLAFVEDGGYAKAGLWLSDGWELVRREGWRAPLYWEHDERHGWREFTLSGMRTLAPDAPVTHVSHYEADAFATWAGARLPREGEWEHAAEGRALEGNFVETLALHPRPTRPDPLAPGAPAALFGDVWEWTASAYLGYPGYRPAAGALGEYNGKFMANQMVLRGGSCASPRSHLRASYRNFFHPHARWQFSGLRLARDAR